MTTHLVRMQALRDRTRRALTENIDRMRGPKALVIDPTLSGPLGLIAEKQLLKDHGVEKTFHLRSEPLETDQRRIMYLVREKMSNMKLIADHIKHHIAQRQKLEYYVCMVPRKTIICERILEEEGVYGEVQLGEFDLDLIPFEDDLLSMEVPDGFRESVVDGNPSVLYYAARSILRLESLFGGRIPKIKGKGHAAKAVADMLLRLQREAAAASNSHDDSGHESGIDELILLDREVDLITPMMTQLTYEGLIDDIFGISHGIVELPASLAACAQSAPRPAGTGAQAEKKVKVQFSGSDQLFAQLRDVNFEQVGPILGERARVLKAVQDEKEAIRDKSVGQIKDYVKKLMQMNIQQEKNLLSLHTGIALEIKGALLECGLNGRLELEQDMLQARVTLDKALEYIEEMMYLCEPLLKVLRLLCLASLIFNGITGKRFDALRHLLTQVYGLEALLSLSHLDKAGLLKRSETPAGAGGLAVGMLAGTLGGSAASAAAAAGMSVAANLSNLTNLTSAAGGWEAVRRRLNCIVGGEDGGEPQDVSYVYSGYAPVSLRVIEKALRPPAAGWASLEDSLKILPGPLFEAAPDPPPPPANGITPPHVPAHRRPCKVVLVFFVYRVTMANTAVKVVLIFFVYGVTMAEVSAVRLLARLHNDAAAGGGGAGTAGIESGGGRVEYLVGTTRLTSGEGLLASLLEVLPKPSPPAPAPAPSAGNHAQGRAGGAATAGRR